MTKSALLFRIALIGTTALGAVPSYAQEAPAMPQPGHPEAEARTYPAALTGAGAAAQTIAPDALPQAASSAW